MKNEHGLYIVLISVHGLIRATGPELGRDPDTGGQITYVMEMANQLARHPRVAQVDLFTRRIFDASLDPDYTRETERLGSDNARIVRIPCGPKRYLRKESLWPHLDEFVDRTVTFLRRQRHTPHLFHSHYADAGYVGHELSRYLGIPLVHTGHSLGHSKRNRLLEGGANPERIERQYRLAKRIQSEERTLAAAERIICSTRQEVDSQWGHYANTYNTRMIVIPPGTDTDRFSPPHRGWAAPGIQRRVDRFLRNPRLPIILALARPDPRKNLRALVRAYAETPGLREQANLVIVAGNRTDIRELEDTSRQELTDLILDMDRYDLYGHVAFPKNHDSTEVPDLYRLAVRRRGVFVNPALTEPFGLTLIEAAACGLPIVATDDGGPRDIISNCNNGLLINALDTADIGARLVEVLGDRTRWRRFSEAGRSGVRRHYTWNAHVQRYIREMGSMIDKLRPRGLPRKRSEAARKRLLQIDRMLVCDIDNTLVGESRSLSRLLALIRQEHHRLGFVVATGRSLELTREILEQENIPQPDMLITSVGTEIHEGRHREASAGWSSHLSYRWDRNAVVAALQDIPGLRPQDAAGQQPFKVSYYVDGHEVAPDAAEPDIEGGQLITSHVRERLRAAGIRFTAAFSHGQYLDILPDRASKGKAVRYLADKWEIPVNRVLVAGDSGNDEEMLRGSTLGVVVGNYSHELEPLRGAPGIYFAEASYAAGILEGIQHYGFLDSSAQLSEKGTD